MNPVAILNAGMVTGVGFNVHSACAAIRCAITGFVETGFMFDGEWLIGCPVPFEERWRGREKLLEMVVPAIQESILDVGATRMSETPLLLCVAERDRPGRLDGLDASFLHEVQVRIGQQFHSESRLITKGRLGGIEAIDLARGLVASGRPYCIVAGVDSFLVGQTLSAYNAKGRLQTATNSDGFIPGEAGASVLVGPVAQAGAGQVVCLGIGYGTEPATVESEEPLRGDGLAEAFKSVFADSKVDFGRLDYRITDASGEQYAFKEATLALSRLLRERKEEFDIWHPADCIGEVGAAIVPVVLGIALTAAKKGYAPGPGVLCHFSADGNGRAALVLQAEARRAA